MCAQKQHKKHQSKLLPIASVLTLSAIAIAATPLFASADNVSGQTDVYVDVASAIAMTITGNNDDGSQHSESGVDYNSVDNFSPAEAAGSTLDGRTLPATAVSGVSSSFANISPSSIINGSAENGFRSTITVYTNNVAGYFLTVRDADNNTNLSHTGGSNAYIPTTSNALVAGTAGWNYDVTRYGTKTGDIWAPTADGQDSITIENNAITPTDTTIDTLPTKTSNGRTTYVDYNVATADDQTSGAYADTLVYTATADASISSPMSISRSAVTTAGANNLAVTLPLYSVDGQANTTFYLLTKAQYDAVKSGTPVSEVGGTTLTATRTSSTPVTYNVNIPAQAATGDYYIYADIAGYAEDYATELTVEAVAPSPMNVSTSTITTAGADNITVALPINAENGQANTTFYLLTEAQYAAVKSGTPVSEVGGTTLTATRTSSTPVTYNVDIPAQETAGTYYIYADVAGYDEDYVTEISVETAPSNVTVNKGTGIDSVSGGGAKVQGTTVTLSATPATGYHFTGWTVNSGGVTVNNNQFTMPANDVTVTANAALNTCPITYNSNAPSGTTATGTTADSSMTYGSNATLTANGFAVTGYAFQGWAESADGEVVFNNNGSISGTTYCTNNNTSKTLYAKWAKKYNYTLNLKMNDGSSDNYTILNYANTTDTSHTFSLSGQTPTRSGYDFKGWATTSTGTSYITSQTLNSSSAGTTPTSDGFPVTTTLYAIWEVAIPYMQDQANINQCKNAAVGTTFTLTDSRDGNEYQVRKLADGKCWMVQNLRLVGPKTLTSADSNVASSFNLTGSNSSAWCAQDNAACDNQSLVIDSGNNNHGAYYNWYTATAGSGAYGNASGNVASSICPKGWRLPTGGNSGEFQILYNAYPSYAAMTNSSGPAFVMAGVYEEDATYDQDMTGYYWSSTAYNNNLADNLSFIAYYSSTYPTDANNKYYGYSVRCLAQ